MGGVSEPMPGGKGKKSVNVELNLVPFIDLMTVCITFLLITAVWTQTGRINIDQSVQRAQEKPKEQKEPPKRLIIMLDKSGFSLKWADNPTEVIPMGSNGYNIEALKAKLKGLKDQISKDQKVVVAPEDTVAYTNLIAVMDTLLDVGLPNMMVADAASVQGEIMK